MNQACVIEACAPWLDAASVWTPGRQDGWACTARIGEADDADPVDQRVVESVLHTRLPRLHVESSSVTLGLPTFTHKTIHAVLLMRFRAQDDACSAIEVWSGHKGRFELSLGDAFYAGLERFGRVSRQVNFPKGSGLPGRVWSSGTPTLMRHIGQSDAFLRSSGAESAGLTTALGLPVIDSAQLVAVVTWLTPEASPISRGLEVWSAPEASAGEMRRQMTHSPWAPSWSKAGRDIAVLPGQGVVGKAWASQQPELIDLHDEQANDPWIDPRLDAMEQDGLRGVIAIPHMVLDAVQSVTVLAW